jgi:hypothetical protein
MRLYNLQIRKVVFHWIGKFIDLFFLQLWCDFCAWVFYYLEVEKAKAGENGICGNSIDGGKLKEAATKKADESILIQIGIESEIP